MTFIDYLALVLGVFGAYILVGTLLGAVRYANAAASMVWCLGSVVAVVWALARLGVLA